MSSIPFPFYPPTAADSSQTINLSKMGDASSSDQVVTAAAIDHDDGGDERTRGSKKRSSGSIFLEIREHPADGSITRPTVLNLPPTPKEELEGGSAPAAVLSKDLPLNPTLNTSLRLFLPNPINARDDDDDEDKVNRRRRRKKKLPIIIYYHGGGFVLFSPDFVLYHQFCLNMAASLPALVVSLDYRLAPENRLPAAYDDAVDALLWVRGSTADPWILEHGDLSRCFLMGSSSGGNMAYFAGLRAAKLELDPPMKVRGVVLIQPYLGGEERTQSEAESEEDDILPLRANDMMWRLALPAGATRDHPFCNVPLAASASASPIDVISSNIMLMGCKGDPLFDRQKMFLRVLTAAAAPGTRVVDCLEEEGYHAIELFDPLRADAMFARIRDFIN